MTKHTIPDIASFIRENKSFLIVTHANPDGDAIGSSFAMLNFLRENGKEAEALLPEDLPLNYREFVTGDFAASMTKDKINTFGACLCIDVSTAERIALGAVLSRNDISIPLVNIDHHPDNTLFGDVNLVDSGSAAAAAIVFNTACAIKDFKISPKTATLMLLGIVMDTGCFRFDNTSPCALRDAASLIELGASYSRIINAMYFTRPLAYLKFGAEAILDYMNTACDGKFAWISIEDQLLEKYSVKLKDIEGIIDSARSIDSAVVAGIIYRKNDGFKISLRSKNPSVSVGRIARKIKGGGHEMAAGAFIQEKNKKEAERILVELVQEELKTSGIL
ncbi:MAG: hypothetical protein A2020_05365 [Lentisphaerae bacterium GWF2_45_14]|nr:MAG: hypothetical protein A2020_05365 [Lentisphaerae bacterium GWF2_45_14]